MAPVSARAGEQAAISAASGAGGPEPGRDGVVQALLQARKLIESTVNLHRRTVARHAVVTMKGNDAAVANAVEALVDRARHGISIALPAGGDRAEVMLSALRRLNGPDHERIPVRLLCTPGSLSDPAIRAALESGVNTQVKVVDAVMEMLIVDGGVAMVRSSAERGGGDVVSVIEDTASVRALDLLFAGAWSGAVRPAEHRWISERLRTESARRILERLCKGYTDDVAAREVDVSLRTYRRHVAEIMRALGANSRFQAGVRAVELGLLSTAE